jgi:8-oxo-dGTP diphosphatase
MLGIFALNYITGKKMKKKKGTSLIFVNRLREVLLVLRDNRSDIPFPNYWDILGGNVEEDETPEQCICREMKEEININIENPSLFRMYDFADRIEYTYWQIVDFDLDKMDLLEGQRLKWFSENEIYAMGENDLAFGFQKVLMDFYRERPFDYVNPIHK